MFFLLFPSLLRLRQCLEDNERRVVSLPSLNVFRGRQPGGAVFFEDSKTEKRGAALCPTAIVSPGAARYQASYRFVLSSHMW